jgi:hypothetical protein
MEVPVHPASPDPRAAIDAILEPLRAETDRVDRALADNEAFLAEHRVRGLDAETRDLLSRAAQSPTAPESVRRVARQVAAGRITWDDVFAHRAGPDGEAFLHDAFATAREHVSDDPTPVEVPEAALETGIDPVEVAADIARTRADAQAAHDAVFRP